MPELSLERLKAHRARMFRILPELRLHTLEQAVRFVNERGFVFFWPVKGFPFPSLWVATAGDRPVADEHDDPGHITWNWKDGLLGKKVWYYGRVLLRRNMMISLTSLPYFYALSPNYGDYENDYLIDYQQGLLTADARAVYEALLKKGALDTLSLRRTAHMEDISCNNRFNRALDELQTTFRILPVAVAPVGAWRYAFVYDIVARHFPELVEKARPISEKEARLHLAQCYFEALGASTLTEFKKMFKWQETDCQRVIQTLINEGFIVEVKQTGKEANTLSLPELVTL
ncbi:MAG: crosslink repair DNA glycosylase YcaQ family protein [Anaerolineales bacterium]